MPLPAFVSGPVQLSTQLVSDPSHCLLLLSSSLQGQGLWLMLCLVCVMLSTRLLTHEALFLLLV